MRHCSKAFFYISAAIFIWVVSPFLSFSQLKDDAHSQLVIQLQKSKADTGRVSLLLKLGQYYVRREYYLYKTGNPRTQFDSACYFAEEALHLSEALKYENGKNEAILIKGDALIRKNEIRSALTLLNTLNEPTRFRLLIILGRHYIFHTDRTKKDLDSSMFFLERANKIAVNHLPEKWQYERIHINAMQSFIAEGLQQSRKLYQTTIDKVSLPGNEENEALLWHELATLIPLREQTGITRLYCFEKMFSLYEKSGNQERQAWVLKTIADIHLVNGELDLAETELLDVLERYKAIGYRDLHYIYDLLAVTSRYKGDFSKCIFYGSKAVESVEATHDSVSATTFYRRLANMYRESGQPDKSVEWYSKVLRDRVFDGDNNGYVFRDAFFFAKELIKIKRAKEALAYMLDIEAKNKPLGVHAEACLLGSLAFCYHAVKQERQAEKYYAELIKLSGQLQEDNEITSDIHYELGQYFIGKTQYRKAAFYLQKALNTAETTNSLPEAKDIHLLLFRADSGMGNYPSAMKHLLRHKLLSDSIFNETRSWQMEELRVQYETAKKEKDIETLNNQNHLQRIGVDQANRTKNITLACAVLLVIVVGLLFNRYLLKHKSNHKLQVHQKELDQKNIFLETLNTKQHVLLKEKEWLIKEIHHRVKNNLQMVTSLLNSQAAYLDNDAAVLAIKDSLRRMQAMSLIHQKLYLSGNISTISMPEYIRDLLSYLYESFDTGNRIVFQQTIEPIDLDVSQAIPLGLIINECIVNAIKYAFPGDRSGSVSINLKSVNEDHVILNISDNGIGLPMGFDVMEHNSLGFGLVRGLAKQLHGSVSIVSDKGLSVIIRFEVMTKPTSDEPFVNS
ncbi:Two-component sensor histidine kinase, contains HisKA and HATPase domains [Chitinophaga filiformis]|uniref:histidine kinase n=1 Tax=Chitinophaga filiformis TaxID=104663 RepID=A0A1G7NTG4_CHIFI|nr:Two-component sensor histidine kinase, contains HisKA and HATPase domains [Chitinophaga filiformis]